MIAWLPLLAAMAIVFTVASGQPEELPAIGDISGSEVSAEELCIFLFYLIKILVSI